MKRVLVKTVLMKNGTHEKRGTHEKDFPLTLILKKIKNKKPITV